jgi:hypothetical protein
MDTPNIVWDGLIRAGGSDDKIVCLANNGEESFMNLRGGEDPTAVTYDTTAHQCTLPRLPKVSFEIAGDD